MRYLEGVKISVCKRLLILIFLFFGTTQVKCQSAIEIKYDRSHLSLTPKNKLLTPFGVTTIGMIMILNDSFALVNFEDFWPQYKRNKKRIGDKLIDKATFFDLHSGSRYQEEKWPGRKRIKYLVRDTSITWNWQFSGEEKIILDKKCKSALTIDANNDSTIVWYTNELSFLNGPLYYDSIPGVVLEAFDQRRNAHIFATKIKERRVSIFRPKQGTLVSLSEWRKIYAALSKKDIW